MRFALLIAFAAVLVPVVIFTNFGRYIIDWHNDGVQLSIFSRRIADADRAVAKCLSEPVEMTFSGDELKTILHAVSSGSSARMPDAVFMSAPFAIVTFHRGTNTLGELSMSHELFALSGSVFFDDSSGLNQTIYAPLRQKLNETYATGKK